MPEPHPADSPQRTDSLSNLITRVSSYYSEKLAAHGCTPRGVDWNGAEGQQLRFSVLLDLARAEHHPSTIDDYGCGYGALLDHLMAHRPGSLGYEGFDVSSEMVMAAKARHPGHENHFYVGARSRRVADFAVASGIFNVMAGTARPDWERYIETTLDTMHECSRRGFAFNCLTSYSDPEKQRDHLYYGNPGRWFDHCKQRYTRHVALRHDYGLYEFTLIVRREPSP